MSGEDNDFIFRQVGRSSTLDLIQRLERVRLSLREDKWMTGAEVLTDAIAEISRLRAGGVAQAPIQRALALAIQHIEHMAAFITEANSDYHVRIYSLESLGEDLPDIKAALAVSSTTRVSAAEILGDPLGGVSIPSTLRGSGKPICQNCGDPVADALHAAGFCGTCREMGCTVTSTHHLSPEK